MRKATSSLAAVLFASLLAMLLGGCGSSTMAGTSERGHLVIVGGGLKDDNAAVFTRFVELCAPGPIGIVPIASGDGITSGEHTAERWRKYSGTRPVVVIPLTQNDTTKADDPEIAKQIASCGGLWFTGGDQARVVKVLHPDGRRSACLAACFGVLNRNGVIGGTSAGAAIMSDPMITGGRSNSAKSSDPESPDDRHVTTSLGLGFFSFGLTDQHFAQRGRLGRTIDALRDTGQCRSFCVSENCAIVVDRGSAAIEAIGAQYAVWLVDASAPNAFAPDRSTVQVSILGTGDRADARSLKVTPEASLRDVRTTGASEVLQPVPNVWTLASVRIALNAAAEGRAGTGAVYDDRTLLTVHADEHSGVYVGRPDRSPTFVNFWVTVSPAAAARAR